MVTHTTLFFFIFHGKYSCSLSSIHTDIQSIHEFGVNIKVNMNKTLYTHLENRAKRHRAKVN